MQYAASAYVSELLLNTTGDNHFVHLCRATVFFTKIYNDSAVAKIPAVLDYLGTVVEKKKIGCIRIDGGTPSTSRQTLVNDFQERDDIKAAVLSIKAAGVGLTLTAAGTVIFTELTWTTGDIIQAEDRAHRIGQVLDGEQNKLEVINSQSSSSPGKQTLTPDILGKQSLTSSSPGKQKRLDSFVKRCSSASDPPVVTQKRKL